MANPLIALVSFPKERLQKLFYFLCLLFVFGLVFSRAVVNLVAVLLVLLAIMQMPLKARFYQLIKNKPAILLLSLYGFFLVSFFYTQYQHKWAEYIIRYLALLQLPLAFGLLPALNRKQIYNLLFVFTLFTSVLTFGTLIQYFLNYEKLNEAITHSDSLVAINGIFHIYFGFMQALAVIFGGFIYQNREITWHASEKYLVLTLVIINFIALHILAYRTGLLALYIAIAWLLFYFIKTRKRYLMGIGLLVMFIGFPVVAYFSLESVQRRVENTKIDIARYVQGKDINHYSIAQRFAAWETGLAVFKSHWLIGVGLADVTPELNQQYARKDFGLIKENQVGIHNQYLHLAVGTGCIGLLIFLAVLLYPFFKDNWQHDWLTKSVLIAFAVAMLVENFSQRHLGLNLFLFFYGLLVIQKENRCISQLEDQEFGFLQKEPTLKE